MSFRTRLLVLTFVALTAAGLANAQMSNDECLGCHGDASAGAVHVDPVKFGASIHSSMGCADCHADIKEYPHEPKPAKVDCANCHPDAVSAWQKGWHARAVGQGNDHAATCLSCHGGNAHTILPKSDPKSPTTHAKIPATCGTCHGQKFVMEGSQFTTQPMFSYQQSVHGKAIAAGNQKAAVCTDCHGSHEVLPANDPNSPSSSSTSPRPAAHATRM